MKRFFYISMTTLIVLLVINWGTVERLVYAWTLLDPDDVAENFSNIDRAFNTVTIPKPKNPTSWAMNPRDLPPTVTIGGEKELLTSFLQRTRTTSLLVVRDGSIVYENYFDSTNLNDQRIHWSISKSIVSLLIGIAVDEGSVVDIDDLVTDYVPSLKDSAYSGVTLRNVLHMSSGVQWNENALDSRSDVSRFVRTVGLGGSLDEFVNTFDERSTAPGLSRHYKSIDTHVLSMVLRNATGKSIPELFNDKIWTKLGAGARAQYVVDGDSVAFVTGGIVMRTRDLALIGELLARAGEWNGEQIIPAKWISLSTVSSAPSDQDSDDFGLEYGLHWWVPPKSNGAFFGLGIFDQYLYVDPKSGIVIIKNSTNLDFRENGPSGLNNKLETMDLFRSIVAHYSHHR